MTIEQAVQIARKLGLFANKAWEVENLISESSPRQRWLVFLIDRTSDHRVCVSVDAMTGDAYALD